MAVLRQIPMLTELDCSDNRLLEVPSQLVQLLPHLEILNLENNRLKVLLALLLAVLAAAASCSLYYLALLVRLLLHLEILNLENNRLKVLLLTASFSASCTSCCCFLRALLPSVTICCCLLRTSKTTASRCPRSTSDTPPASAHCSSGSTRSRCSRYSRY